MEIYAFGSVARGEIDEYSDVDLLLLKEENENITHINKNNYSLYSQSRIREIWEEGNPFAWHLHLESKCIFSNYSEPYIIELGKPKKYQNMDSDLEKFYTLYLESKNSLSENNDSIDFDLSMIFLAIRNFATCFSLGKMKTPTFSRDAAIKINKYSIDIEKSIYDKLKSSRLLATRGKGQCTNQNDLEKIKNTFVEIDQWFHTLKNA